MKKNNKTIIITLLITILVIFLTFIVLFIRNNGIKSPENSDSNQKMTYSFGDQIIISKLSAVKDKNFDIEEDYSRWHVLSDDGEYLTLMCDEIFSLMNIIGEDTVIKNTKEVFEDYGIDFGTKGDIRLINETDLKEYFNCDFNNLTCNPTESWLKNLNNPPSSALTSVKLNEKIVLLNFDYSLSLEDSEEEVLAPWYPVIKILKNSI